MDILVLGFGAVGSVLIQLLARESWVSSVSCGTFGAEMAARSLSKDSRINVFELDCMDHQALGRAVGGHHLVINASLPSFNLPVLEACLVQGVNYQDMCLDLDNPPSIDAQFAMDRELRKAGLTALMCTGISPGITNVLVAEAASQMAVSHDVHIHHYEHQVSSRFVPSWSTAIMLDQVSTRPFVWRNRRYERVEPLSEPERASFLGVGRIITVYMTVGDEPLTIPRVLNVDTVCHKMGGDDLEDALVLKKYGLFSEDPVAIEGVMVSPRQFLRATLEPVPALASYERLVRDKILQDARFASKVKVYGNEAGGEPSLVCYTVVYPDLKTVQTAVPGATYIAYPTAFAALAFARLLPRLPKGAILPESLSAAFRQEILSSIQGFGAQVIRR